jgi:GrpB-like predicted nucleotidyltransferase (UPF0157 family)
MPYHIRMPTPRSEAIVIADYDPRWPDLFEEERVRIEEAIGEWLEDIQHAGSTAVPGLAAKSVIDIMAGLRSWDDRERCSPPLEALGYENRGENALAGALIFVKLTKNPLPGQTYRARDGKIRARTHNLHLMPISHLEWHRHILFRDYLRQDRSVARRYGELKRTLADKHSYDIDAYTNAKSEFIEVVIGRARVSPPITVRIVDYDPKWPAKYAEERAQVLKAAGEWLVDIQHVGSTSVPGLAAKPVIDMMAAVETLEDAKNIIEPLAALGYSYVPEYEVELPRRRYFRKGRRGSDGDKYHLHVVEPGGEFWCRHLAFRDYLREHPEAVREYALLKRRLAIEHGTDVDGYTDAKTDFIRGIETKAAAATSPSSSAAERGAPANR